MNPGRFKSCIRFTLYIQEGLRCAFERIYVMHPGQSFRRASGRRLYVVHFVANVKKRRSAVELQSMRFLPVNALFI